MVQPLDVPEMETLRLMSYGTEVDLVAAGVANILAVMPEWVPRGGNTEMVLLESLAVMLGPEILSLQLLGPRVVEQVMGLLAVTRSPGLPARGRVSFWVTGSSPTQVIPAGTRLRMLVDASVESVDLFTTEELSIVVSESNVGEVNVVLDRLGSLVNGTPMGIPLAVVDNLPFIESVETASSLTGGADTESDDVFFSRAASVLARFNSTLVHPEQFEYAALSQPGIGRALTLDNYDPAAPGDTSYGHVTVAVAGMDGLAVDATVMEQIRVILAGQALASLTIHVIEPTYTTLVFGVGVKAKAGWTEEQVINSVTAAITAWVTPLTWVWDDTATQFETVAVVANAAGVREVVAAGADQPLAGVAPLPQLGSIDVTLFP